MRLIYTRDKARLSGAENVPKIETRYIQQTRSAAALVAADSTETICRTNWYFYICCWHRLMNSKWESCLLLGSQKNNLVRVKVEAWCVCAVAAVWCAAKSVSERRVRDNLEVNRCRATNMRNQHEWDYSVKFWWWKLFKTCVWTGNEMKFIINPLHSRSDYPRFCNLLFCIQILYICGI